MASTSENNIECFASTGVNTPETMWQKWIRQWPCSLSRRAFLDTRTTRRRQIPYPAVRNPRSRALRAGLRGSFPRAPGIL